MSSDPIAALLDEVRRAAIENDVGEVYLRLTDRLAANPPAVERGALHLARAVLRQNLADPRPAAADAVAAWEILRRTDDRAYAAYAAAASAGMLQRCGRLAESVDLAVEATVLLDRTDMEPAIAVRIANALAVVFSQLSAFDVAADLAERAFLGCASMDTVSAEIVSFTMAYLTIDGCHAHDHPPERWVELARSAATWLEHHAESRVGRETFAHGVPLEVAMLVDDAEEIERLVADDDGSDPDVYAVAAPRVIGWHSYVRGAALGRVGRYPGALRLLDSAVPKLALSDDQPRLARALAARAEARRALGDADGAFADAMDLANRARRWQVDQVGRLAAQISRRAELEHAQEQLSKRAARLAEEAATDVITGVSTRRELEHQLDALEQTADHGAVIVFDLDRFKDVNDRHGHHVGDVVLRRVGGLLRATLGADDFAARYGGEEFVVILRDADSAVAQAHAERVRARLAGESWGQMAVGLRVTSSAGVAVGGLGEVRVLLHRADNALYDAKRSGRDRVVVAGTDPLSSAPV